MSVAALKNLPASSNFRVTSGSTDCLSPLSIGDIFWLFTCLLICDVSYCYDTLQTAWVMLSSFKGIEFVLTGRSMPENSKALIFHVSFSIICIFRCFVYFVQFHSHLSQESNDYYSVVGRSRWPLWSLMKYQGDSFSLSVSPRCWPEWKHFHCENVSFTFIPHFLCAPHITTIFSWFQ